MKTKISDVVVPEVFAKYIIQKSVELSKLVQSGIITTNQELNNLVTGGGLTVNMPFWNQITGEDEVLSDSTALTPDKVGADKDIACLLIRGKAWSANDLAGALAGDDPMNALGTMVADWWNARQQATLVSILKGALGSTSMAGHVKSEPTAVISAELLLDTKQLLGDAAPKLTTLVMHSAVYTALQKQNLIAFIPNSTGQINMPTYMGYNVIYDDTVPVNAGVYSTYLMGNGVIGLGQGSPVSMPAVEVDRDSLAGDDILVNRRAFVMHPFGIKWAGTPTGVTPTNAELATTTNWTKVYDSKNIPIVELQHKVVA